MKKILILSLLLSSALMPSIGSLAQNKKKSIFQENSQAKNNLLLKVDRIQSYDPAETRPWGYGCYRIASLEKEDSGLIKLNFEHESYMPCEEKIIYNVTTEPKNGIRGSSGINGKTAKSFFSIQVLPSIKTISLEIKKRGKVTSESFNVEEWIQRLHRLIEAENSLPAWQAALNNAESLLAEKSKQDKAPPFIKIESPESKDKNILMTDSYSILIKGQITDDAGVLKVVVAGKSVGLDAYGKFVSKVKLGYGFNDILIQAEDVNGNISEKKITILRQEIISDSVSQDIDIPLKGKSKNSDAYAVVVGIEKYQYVPDAIHANNDAEVFREYLIETMGFKKENIKIITDRKATQAEIEKLLGADGWLARNSLKNKSDVVVYFSGHGMSNANSASASLLPYDVDPNYSSGMNLKNLYKNLASLEAKSVILFLDACFTGQSRDEKLLIDKARPVIVRESDLYADEKITVISASSGSQVSSAMHDSNHGIFTYHLLKGLRGEADKNKDKKIFLSELFDYVSKEVKVTAAKIGRVQTPVASGLTNILIADIE
jgi:Caspase domain/Glucodextranase, domain B